MRRSEDECVAVFTAPCDLGVGLFAGRNFSAGEVLFHFTGPEISSAECIARGEAEANALQIGPQTYIDLEPPGVFTNHSCEPNIGIRHGSEAFALRDIYQGEELRFDYSCTMSERRWTMACRCGAASCRGVVEDFDLLPPTLQARYLALGIVQPFIIARPAS